MKRSFTITGIFISLAGFLLEHLGLQIPQTDLEIFFAILFQIGGLVLAWYGRVRKGDITLLGKRKKND